MARRLRGHRSKYPIFKGIEGCNPHLRVAAIAAHPSIPLKKYYFVAKIQNENWRCVKVLGHPQTDTMARALGATVIAADPEVGYGHIWHRTAPTDTHGRRRHNGVAF